MVTHVRYCSLTNTGNVGTFGPNPETAKDGGYSKFVNDNSLTSLRCGMTTDGSNHAIFELFLEFNCAGIDGTVTDAVLQLRPSALVGTDLIGRVVEARACDYGSSVTTGDFLTNTAYAALQRLTTIVHTTLTVDVWASMTEETLIPYVDDNKDGGPIRCVLCIEHLALDGVVTDGAEFKLNITGSSGVHRPRLIITTDQPDRPGITRQQRLTYTRR